MSARTPQAGQRCWAIVGPTASGKTAVSLRVGERHPVEIVSVDSMQVYRGMDIGTAKPTPAERARVPHHMIDVLEPQERCNVALFCRMAREAMAGIRSRGRRPLLVGGSGMYLKGVMWGLAEAPGRDEAVRRRLRAELERLGAEAMHARLAALDPEAAERIHPNDVQRLLRALEVCELADQPPGERDQFDGPPRLEVAMVGLRRLRSVLHRRIEQRVGRMMEAGLLAEVASLRGRLGPQASQAVGYKELMEHLEGRISLAQAVELIKRNTRRLARRQMTWLRHFPQLCWVEAERFEAVSDLAHACARRLEGSA